MAVLMWLMFGVAIADPMQNLMLASDSNSTVETREAAFADIVRDGATEIQYLLDVASDRDQSTRSSYELPLQNHWEKSVM